MASELPNPLLALHERSGGEFQAYDRVQIVSTFGEPEAEYAAIRKAAALLDQPQRGILELSGKDRLPFLNNLLTNQTWDKDSKSGLQAGQGAYAFFLNRNGRVVADVNVIERSERTLLEMDAALVESVRAAFDKYLFGEQVTLIDRTGELHQIAVHGPGALGVLAEAVGAELPELPVLGSAEVRILDAPAVIWRDDPCGVPGYHLILQTSDVERVWAGLIERASQSSELGRRALRPAGWAAFNAARIEAGRPIFRIDFDETVLPHETGQLARAVSFTKGCYLGQEIVARMHARGQIARQIAGIKMIDDSLPIAGAEVQDDNDNQIGVITSSTISPMLSNTAICLGLVKKPFFSIGSIVNVPAEGEFRKGTVVELPFLKN